MSIRPLTIEPHPLLRQKADQVPKDTRLDARVADMRDTMRAADGIGIAAPQVGESLRLFLIEPNLFFETDEKKIVSRLESNKPKQLSGKPLSHWVFVNPVLIKKSFKQVTMEEGCLSVPKIFGTVKRPAKVTVDAYDERGNAFRVRAQGLFARVLQHELDHLDGTLFIDKAIPGSIHEYTPVRQVYPGSHRGAQGESASPKPHQDEPEDKKTP